MRHIHSSFLLILFLLLSAGCTADTQSEPVADGPRTTPTNSTMFGVGGTATANADVRATRAGETLTPFPTRPTNTPPPTATATVTPIPPPTETAQPTPTPLPACDTVAALGDVPPPFVVVDGPWPRPAAENVILRRVETDGAVPLLHLGFDVESDPAPLPAILDVLDLHQVKTTFFVLGSWAEANPELVAEITARGHELGNQAYSHTSLTELSDGALVEELKQTETLIGELTGQTTQPFFRPPFGSETETSVQAAYDAGWTTVKWSGGANEFLDDADEDAMCAALLRQSEEGAILLVHTFTPEMPAVLDRYLRELYAAGIGVVPLSLLLNPTPADFLQQQ